MFRPNQILTGSMFAGLCLLSAALPIQARDKDKPLDGPAPAVFQAVLDCKSLGDPAARLLPFICTIPAFSARAMRLRRAPSCDWT